MSNQCKRKLSFGNYQLYRHFFGILIMKKIYPMKNRLAHLQQLDEYLENCKTPIRLNPKSTF